MRTVALFEMMGLVVSGFLLSIEFGWKVGLSVFLIGYALKPWAV